ncbi:MAG: hypothetical protein WEC00_02430 [Dongiaceae bacterium]
MSVAAPPKIDPIELAVATWRALWRLRDRAILLALPLLLLGFGFDALVGAAMPAWPPVPTSEGATAEPVPWGPLLFLWGAALVMIAFLISNLTRLLLIGPAANGTLLGLRWSMREVRVLVRFVLAFLFLFVLALPAAFTISMVMNIVGNQGAAFVLMLIFLGVMMGVALRLMFTVYAAALDWKIGFAEAWRLSRGNGFRLVGAYLAVNLPIVAVSIVATLIVAPLREAAPYMVLFLFNVIAVASSLGSVAMMALALDRLANWRRGGGVPISTP